MKQAWMKDHSSGYTVVNGFTYGGVKYKKGDVFSTFLGGMWDDKLKNSHHLLKPILGTLTNGCEYCGRKTCTCGATE